MSIQKNINNLLDKSFKNTNLLPQKLLLEDVSEGVRDYVRDLNLTINDEDGKSRIVPIIYLTQERWAEYKKNWATLREENGEEAVMPFMALVRNSVKQGTSPLKRTIPNKKKFTFYKMPVFDGTYRGFELIKIPQPVWVDVDYELRFLSHYLQDIDKFYEKIIMEGFSDLQGYMKVNGYNIPITMKDPSEENTVDDVTADRKFQVVVPLEVRARLVDPSKFEKVQTVSKISINISEKID